MKFTNWKNPSLKQLLKEYKVEHEMKGGGLWANKRDFVNAVREGKVEKISPQADTKINHRSRTKDKGELVGLIKGYRSYPKYRNEATLDAIYEGYSKNSPMDRPIVADLGDGRRVFSGNTRMDAAFHSGVDPEVLVVKARKFAAKLTAEGHSMKNLSRKLAKLREFRSYYPDPYGNPYGKDFREEQAKERRHGLIKAGLVGAGLLGGGALVGRGLFKAGIGAAARRADDLEREISTLRAAKSAVAAPVSAPKGKVVAPKSVKSKPASAPPPPAPVAPPPAPAPIQPSPSAADKSIKVAAQKSKIAPEAAVVDNLAKSGAISEADAAAEVQERLASLPSKPPRKLTPAQLRKAQQAERRAKSAAKADPVTPKVEVAPTPKTPAPSAEVAPAPALATPAKSPAKPAPKTQAPAKPVAKPVEEFWEKEGVGKVPLTGTAEQNAVLRKKLEETHAAGGFKGKVAGDVIDEIRASTKPSGANDFPEGLSESLRQRSKEISSKSKASKKPKNAEAEWEESMKEPAKKEPAKKGSKKGSKKDKPLSMADKLAAQVKARREKKKGNKKALAAALRGIRYFNFQTDEGGIPFTGKVAKDRFIKKLRDEDLDRRDANILRAGGAGALAGLMFRGGLPRGKRALIGAGLGGAGVLGARMATDRTRDIYGERSRGAKRAEMLPAVAGLGAAAWLAGKRLKAFAKKIDHRGVKEFGVVSVGTAKKVLGRLRQGGKPTFLRPAGIPEMSMYIPKGSPLEARGQVAAAFAAQGKNVSIEPNTVIVPRENAKIRADSGFAPGRFSDVIGVSLHEHGHAADPILRRYGHALKKRAERFRGSLDPDEVDRLGQGMGRSTLRIEKRANQNVLKQIQAHGTGKEATAWKQWANKQMKQGYRNPMYQSIVAEVGADTLSKKKAILREVPWLRSKSTNLAARLGTLSLRRFSRLCAVRYFEKNNKREKSGLNPYVGAALSGFGSGAALGSLALLKRGATFRSAAKTAGKLGLASAGIVGGGALLGSKIVGDPRSEESAPFMKRAAIGGSLVGAGAGLAGALLLRKTKGGAKALVAASKKTEPFSRPAMWLRKTPIAGAAGIGALGGGIYGGGMGADEGQQVDSIRNLRKDLKKELGRKIRAIKFFGRGDQARWDLPGTNEDARFANTGLGWATDRPMYIPKRDGQGRVMKDAVTGEALRERWEANTPQLWNSVAREAGRQRVNVQRGGRLTRDVFDEMRGAPRQRDASGRMKKREWEKSWFQNKATEVGLTVAGLGGLGAVRYAHNNPDTKIGKAYDNTKLGLKTTKDNLAEIGGAIMKTATNITRRRFSAKLKKLRELDAYAEDQGWDVRDPRGRSARVFAPGSRRRERRPKEWHEKTENERKLWKAGLLASAVGGGVLTIAGSRLVSGKSLVPSRFLPKKPITGAGAKAIPKTAPKPAVTEFPRNSVIWTSSPGVTIKQSGGSYNIPEKKKT